MMGGRDAVYRLKVAAGFVEEAHQDVTLTRWRSAVDNAQLAVENAARPCSPGWGLWAGRTTRLFN